MKVDITKIETVIDYGLKSFATIYFICPLTNEKLKVKIYGERYAATQIGRNVTTTAEHIVYLRKALTDNIYVKQAIKREIINNSKQDPMIQAIDDIYFLKNLKPDDFNIEFSKNEF